MHKIRFWGFNHALAVRKGATQLGVSELELFAIAYRGWFKQDAEGDMIRRLYLSFKVQGDMPHWLKHYLRQQEARARCLAAEDESAETSRMACLSRMVLTILSPRTTNLLKQVQSPQEFSLYC